ncbi:MAG: sortase [Bacilli bacterium]|nr:sortase [Bacilli bacterium]
MKKINFKYQVAAGVILIVGGTLALLSNYIKEKRDVVFSEMNLTLSMLLEENKVEEEIEPIDNSNEEENDEQIQSEEENKKENINYTYEEYLGIIDIPKINLYRGFYNKNSSLNNVKFNLYVLPESNYPDIDKGNLMIAGHSGNYNNSYFANLYKLVEGDEITIHYNNSKYIYKISKIYYEEKDGTVRILRNSEKTTLTLITCTKDDKYHQTIYIAELIEIE